MATVFLAQDLRHDRRVAVKVLRPELAAIIGGDRFLHEIRTTANLQHPHILPLHDSGTAAGSVYYVMPFVEGQSLRDRLTHEKQLPVDEAVRITREVASALDYAHRNGVVHRDIKPENILLHDGQALVADFGIALAVSRSDGGTRMTETGMSLGTPHYMAPEQAMGEREISARADVYALGCVLYECLVGEPPFTGPTAQAIIARVMTDSPRALQTQRHTIPPHVEAAVRTALEKLPADRFPTAAAFSEALASPAYGLGTGLRAAVGGGAATWHPRSWNRVTKVFAGTAAAFALATAWLGFGPKKAAVPLPVIAAVLDDSVGAGTRPFISSTGAVAWVVPGLGIRMQVPGSIAPITLAGSDDAAPEAIGFSPDGSELVFGVRPQAMTVGGARYTVMRLPAAGGVPVAVNTDVSGRPGANLESLRWHDDGFIYVSSVDVPSAQSSILRFPATGGSADTLKVFPSLFAAADAVLPGSRTVLVSLAGAGATDARVIALDISSGDTIQVLPAARTAAWSPSGHILATRTDGSLVAVPADARTGKPIGSAIPVADSIAVNGLGASYSFASTGSFTYVRGAANSAGLGVTRLTLLGTDGNIEQLPLQPTDHPDGALSPNGRYILYTRNDAIWFYDIDVGTHRQLTANRSRAHHNPIWSPDGKLVAFRGDIGDSTSGAIIVTSPDSAPGTMMRIIRHTRPANPSQWLADGTILFHSEQPQLDVLKVAADGQSAPVAILNADWAERAARVSPDGRWVAYVASEDGTPRVYARRWPDLTQKTLVADETLANSFPIWSADSRSLYVTVRSQLSRIDVEPRATGLAVVRSRVVSASASGAIVGLHPDGRRMLHFSRLTGELNNAQVVPRLIVVANWSEVLRQRLGAAGVR
jgi:hypothetical protein